MMMNIKREDLPAILQGEFRLRAFPGEVFAINWDACYEDKLYTCIIKDSQRMDFAKGTLSELMREVLPI